MKTVKIKGFPKYEVSDTGLVISNAQDRPKILKPRLVSQSKKKYLQVSLYNEHCKRNNKGVVLPQQVYIHRLIWESFFGKIPKGMEIDHIDNNPRNNNLDNLQLLTRRENILKTYEGPDIRYLRKLRTEIIKDYIELQNFVKVAEKWKCSAASIWRIINNVVHRSSKGKYKRYQYDNDNNDLFVTTDLRNKTKEQLIELWEKSYGVKYA